MPTRLHNGEGRVSGEAIDKRAVLELRDLVEQLEETELPRGLGRD
jgi:hypothetical protein